MPPPSPIAPQGCSWGLLGSGGTGQEEFVGGGEEGSAVKWYILLNKSERLPAARHSKYAC